MPDDKLSTDFTGEKFPVSKKKKVRFTAGGQGLLPYHSIKETMNNENRNIILKVSKSEFDTILAGLRYWQHMVEQKNIDFSLLPRYQSLMDIATDCDSHNPLTGRQIDSLCEHLNS
jgi:hypothetical protein